MPAETGNTRPTWKGLLGDRRGQGMTEYIILVALVALACFAAVWFFGDVLAAWFRPVTPR